MEWSLDVVSWNDFGIDSYLFPYEVKRNSLENNKATMLPINLDSDKIKLDHWERISYLVFFFE